jgi:hypothetical protein
VLLARGFLASTLCCEVTIPKVASSELARLALFRSKRVKVKSELDGSRLVNHAAVNLNISSLPAATITKTSRA